jgi:hypothetical protein
MFSAGCRQQQRLCYSPPFSAQVFHMERSADSLLNLQNDLPLFSKYDKQAIAALGAEFEIDYINLAYTRTR